MAAMENLKVYKQVCMKIRTTLVSGREDLVSPTLVTRNFVEGFAKCLNDRILPEHSLTAEADESPLGGYAEPLYGNGASANAMDHCTVPFCPFIEPAEGWEIEYSETRCEVRLHRSMQYPLCYVKTESTVPVACVWVLEFFWALCPCVNLGGREGGSYHVFHTHKEVPVLMLLCV